MKKIPLFYPDAQGKNFWDLIAFVSRLYFLFFIPLDLAWVDQEFIFVLYWPITISMLVLLIID
jgi:potassium voltage-gated channel Eag-related subfamily H protein 5